MAIVSLILAIASIVFCWVPILGPACGAIAVVLAKKSENEPGKAGMVKAAMICAIIGLIIGGIYTVGCLACAACGGCAALSEM